MKMNPLVNPSRHRFIAQSLVMLAALPAAASFLSACNGDSNDAPPAGEAAAKEDEPIAASLGYKADATQVDTMRFPKRKGPEGEKQNCKSCQFYTAKNDGWGSCQIIRSGLVKAGGWCNTWAPKPGA